MPLLCRARRWFLGLPWLVVGLSGCAPAAAPSNGVLDLSAADYARDFHLQDTRGQWRSLADYRGKVVMVFFGFTQCPDVCPAAMARAVDVLRLVGDDGTRVQVLFISLDPERDTPDILQSFVGSFHPSIVALRGDLAQTRQTAEDYKVYFRKVPQGGSYTLDHSAMVYLYDPSGHLRRALRPDLSSQDAAQQVNTLLRPS